MRGGGGGGVRDGDADDLSAEVGEAGDLVQGGLSVGGVGVGHGLDDDRGVATDLDVADVNGPGLSPGVEGLAPFGSAQDRPFGSAQEVI